MKRYIRKIPLLALEYSMCPIETVRFNINEMKQVLGNWGTIDTHIRVTNWEPEMLTIEMIQWP